MASPSERPSPSGVASTVSNWPATGWGTVLEVLDYGVHGRLRLVGTDARLLGHEVDERVHGIGPGLGVGRFFRRSRISVRS